MIIPIATLALATHLAVTVADDDVPSFDVQPICRGIAQQGGLDLEPDQTVRQIMASCVADEMAIRKKLVEKWPTFTAADKAMCTGEAGAGGVPSYTELLTCLQMAAEAEKSGD